MAEEVGFEPTVRFHARRFSRPVQSTTLPLLRHPVVNGSRMILKAFVCRENPPTSRAGTFIDRDEALMWPR